LNNSNKNKFSSQLGYLLPNPKFSLNLILFSFTKLVFATISIELIFSKLILLSLCKFLYFLYGFVLFYTYIKGYSLLKYLLKRKNINTVLTIELTFIILGSLIVFTSQPLNWIVALIMFTHLIGVGWLISNPNSYYTMVDINSTDMDSVETASAMIVFGYGVFVYSSKFF